MVLKIATTVGRKLIDIIQKSPELAREFFQMMKNLREAPFFDPKTRVDNVWDYPNYKKTNKGIMEVERNIDEVVKEKIPYLYDAEGIATIKIPTKADKAWKERKIGHYFYDKNKELNNIIQDEDLMGRIMVDDKLKNILKTDIDNFAQRGKEHVGLYTVPNSAFRKDPDWTRAFGRWDIDSKASLYEKNKGALDMIYDTHGGHHIRFVERAIMDDLFKMDKTPTEYIPHKLVEHLFPKSKAKVIKLETKGKKSGTLTEKQTKAYEDLMKTGPKKNGDFAYGGGVGTLFEARV